MSAMDYENMPFEIAMRPERWPVWVAHAGDSRRPGDRIGSLVLATTHTREGKPRDVTVHPQASPMAVAWTLWVGAEAQVREVQVGICAWQVQKGRVEPSRSTLKASSLRANFRLAHTDI